MGRPTFPARNQWNADAAQPARPSAPRAVPRVPPGSGPLVPTLPVDARMPACVRCVPYRALMYWVP